MADLLVLKIDEQRLQREIDALALISENPPPVVTRILFSQADRRGRQFVKNLFAEAGLTIRQDAAGNIFARWGCRDTTLTAVATGSAQRATSHARRVHRV